MNDIVFARYIATRFRASYECCYTKFERAKKAGRQVLPFKKASRNYDELANTSVELSP